MKSLEVSVFFPAWAWIDHPGLRFLFTSYASSLSIRDSIKCRRLIRSPWYQSNWGDRFTIAADQDTKVRFENDHGGYRLATSVDGTATGEGGDIIVIDDPHNVRDGESQVVRKGVLTWWDEVMSTRLNDPKTGRYVIIMQRVHENDLVGHILAKEHGWEHICLPARYEADHPNVWNGDPRKKDGELLWPQRFGEPELASLEASLGSYGTAGQLQQRPAPREGGMFERGWFEIVDRVPSGPANRVRFWDQAATAPKPGTDPDWTAGCKMCEVDGIFYVEDMQRARKSSLDVEKLTSQTAHIDGRECPIWIEQEPGSSGKAIISHYQRSVLKGFACRGNPATGSKELRAEPLSSAAEAGLIRLVAGDWVLPFLEEIEVFPMGKHDDQVDAASGAYEKISMRSGEPQIRTL